LVDLLNNLHLLAEDKEFLLANIAKKAISLSQSQLSKAVQGYGGVRAKKFFAKVMAG
jgi:hypothetical protein